MPLTKIFYWGWRDFTFTDHEVRKPDDTFALGLITYVPGLRLWLPKLIGP